MHLSNVNKNTERETEFHNVCQHKTKSSNKHIILLIMILCLVGCDLNYNTQHRVVIDVEQALVERDSLPDPADSFFTTIDTLAFTPYDDSKIINFKRHQKDLLLKIKVMNFPSDVDEFTLSVFPKYLNQVSYFKHAKDIGYHEIIQQHRNRSNQQRYYSSQKFAFNLDDEDLSKTHYLLIHSENNRYAQLELVDANSYIKADAQFSHFFTMIYSIILAMIVFNVVFYFYNRDLSYLLYAMYMTTALYSLLWQEGKIIDLSWFSWQILGNRSNLVFLSIADLAANLFLYRFMRLKISTSWMVKLVVVCVAFRLGIILIALIQYHIFESLHYTVLSSLFNISIIVSSLLVWIIILLKTTQKFPQAKYLFVAWTLLIVSVILRILFTLDPSPDRIWMPHSYEIAIMLEGLILAFAMANRTLQMREQRDQAVSKYSAAERSIYKHQLITQFQTEMQDLVKDPTLSTEEVAEKFNIKFHLLINQAFPIKNSLVHINDEIHGICTTGLQSIDLNLLAFKFNHVFSTNSRNQMNQYQITTSSNQIMNLLYLPLNPSEHKKTRFIFGLKHNKPINSRLMTEFKSFCEAAYSSLCQAKELHQVALAANTDSMTSCHNRGSIEKIIRESIKHSNRTSVAYVDLDNLKETNDKFGHIIGDQCIIEFAHILKQSFKVHAKVGRIGGDEFIVVFSDTEFEVCAALLENFMETLSLVVLTEAKLKISSSIGLAESRLHETHDSLIKKADLALYHSKKQGRNLMSIYHPKMSY